MEGASLTSSVDLVSWVGTHRYMGYLVRCSACKPALDPQDSRVHIEPCEPYKHRSLEHTSAVDYDPSRWLTGQIRGKRIILWDWRLCAWEMTRDKSAKVIRRRGKEGHWKIKAGSRMQDSGVRSERDGGEGTSKGRPLARSELELAEKTRQYSLPLDLCGIGVILVRGVVKWRGCTLLFRTSEWHNREEEEGKRTGEDEQRRRGTGRRKTRSDLKLLPEENQY